MAATDRHVENSPNARVFRSPHCPWIDHIDRRIDTGSLGQDSLDHSRAVARRAGPDAVRRIHNQSCGDRQCESVPHRISRRERLEFECPQPLPHRANDRVRGITRSTRSLRYSETGNADIRVIEPRLHRKIADRQNIVPSFMPARQCRDLGHRRIAVRRATEHREESVDLSQRHDRPDLTSQRANE